MATKARIWTAACLLSAAPLAAAPTLAAPPAAAASKSESRADATFEVKAEHAEFDMKSGQAILTGQVRVKAAQWDLACERAELRYADGQSIRQARASGGVVFRLGGTVATAPSLDLELEARRATFREGVTIRQGKGWAKATTATVDLDTQKVVMTGVEGAFPVDDQRR